MLESDNYYYYFIIAMLNCSVTDLLWIFIVLLLLVLLSVHSTFLWLASGVKVGFDRCVCSETQQTTVTGFSSLS